LPNAVAFALFLDLIVIRFDPGTWADEIQAAHGNAAANVPLVVANRVFDLAAVGLDEVVRDISPYIAEGVGPQRP
jgi:hypothetical protein